jgi:hypothetical protein
MGVNDTRGSGERPSAAAREPVSRRPEHAEQSEQRERSEDPALDVSAASR